MLSTFLTWIFHDDAAFCCGFNNIVRFKDILKYMGLCIAWACVFNSYLHSNKKLPPLTARSSSLRSIPAAEHHTAEEYLPS